MKVLVACEESQAVCTAFRERGHEAYSCDIQEPSGGHPEWHMERTFHPFKNRTAVTKEASRRQRKNCAAIDKDKAPRLRERK